MLAFFSCRVMSVLEAWDVGSSVTCTMEVNTYRYQVPGVKVHAPVKSGFPLNYISSKCLCSSRAVGVWCCAASFTSFQHVHVIAVVVVACRWTSLPAVPLFLRRATPKESFLKWLWAGCASTI